MENIARSIWYAPLLKVMLPGIDQSALSVYIWLIIIWLYFPDRGVFVLNVYDIALSDGSIYANCMWDFPHVEFLYWLYIILSFQGEYLYWQCTIIYHSLHFIRPSRTTKPKLYGRSLLKLRMIIMMESQAKSTPSDLYNKLLSQCSMEQEFIKC